MIFKVYGSVRYSEKLNSQDFGYSDEEWSNVPEVEKDKIALDWARANVHAYIVEYPEDDTI